jgi:glucose-6-phosphate 1-epimerase
VPPASPDDLQRRLGIPGIARFEEGPGGLARLRLATDAAEAEIYLHGGHVTGYQPRGARPVLFMSPRSRFDANAAIRGGVPVVFPWFGAKADDPAAAMHGFARTAAWDAESVERAADGTVRLVLRLDASATTRAAWPHDFVLRLRVTVGPVLELALVVDNRGSAPLVFEEALHTYLAVADVRAVAVTGLAGTTYVDKTDGMTRKRQDPGPLTLAGETDRVYLATAAACVVDDPGWGRRLVVDTMGSATTVVWNPWASKGHAMADLGEDGWLGMLCIETANAADDRVTLAPGARHEMRAAYRVEPRRG